MSVSKCILLNFPKFELNAKQRCTNAVEGLIIYRCVSFDVRILIQQESTPQEYHRLLKHSYVSKRSEVHHSQELRVWLLFSEADQVDGLAILKYDLIEMQALMNRLAQTTRTGTVLNVTLNNCKGLPCPIIPGQPINYTVHFRLREASVLPLLHQRTLDASELSRLNRRTCSRLSDVIGVPDSSNDDPVTVQSIDPPVRTARSELPAENFYHIVGWAKEDDTSILFYRDRKRISMPQLSYQTVNFYGIPSASRVSICTWSLCMDEVIQCSALKVDARALILMEISPFVYIHLI
ncbi:hypothetical protein CLF_106605 [Clonorchis sinensis]|uniref:Uncharacterized protein n=1 Tax=Clonorchis sinensis TaxID=79923 RepID=G7YQ33_CLOSI|nr:hypothetical protein CLF_106605 [Clonorchis sinensis]